MKKSLRYLVTGSAAALLTSGAVQAAPFITIADTVDVFFLGRTAVDYRTNLFNSSQKHDDFVFTLSPGFEARIGRNSNATISLVFREDFMLYSRYNGQNAQLANVILSGTYNSGPLQSSAGFSYRQTQTNTPSSFVQGGPNNIFVQRDIYTFYVRGKYDISPKFWARGGFELNSTDYTNNDQFGGSFANSDVYSLPINAFYRYSEKLSIGLGYRYRHTLTKTNPSHRSYNDHFVSFAVDGELAPKLHVNGNIGYQIRDVSGSSYGQFAMDIALTYEFSPKLDIFAGGSHDFGISAVGNGQENLSGFLGAEYRLNSFISATGRFEQEQSKYRNSTRTDDTTYLNFAVHYKPNTYWTFTAGYGYTNNSSTIDAASFSGNTFTLAASLRY